MNTTQTTEEYEIDATGRKLGRLASEVAVKLMGKNLPDYQPNRVMGVSVTVTNASALQISNTKLKNKEYDQYSGFPGGRKTLTAEELVAKKGYGELIRRAVNGMLPKNKLRSRRMKNLTIHE